jgi:hypothetical protein
MFGYKSKAQKRREKILTVGGWSLVTLFLIGVTDTIRQKFKKTATVYSIADYKDWSGRG